MPTLKHEANLNNSFVTNYLRNFDDDWIKHEARRMVSSACAIVKFSSVDWPRSTSVTVLEGKSKPVVVLFPSPYFFNIVCTSVLAVYNYVTFKKYREVKGTLLD